MKIKHLSLCLGIILSWINLSLHAQDTRVCLSNTYEEFLAGMPGIDHDNNGYIKRQCTSYAKWRLKYCLRVSGADLGLDPIIWGHARMWDDYALQSLNPNIIINHIPKEGAIAHWNAYEADDIGIYGHVAVVDAVDEENQTVTVSEYNLYEDIYNQRSGVVAPRYIHFLNPPNTTWPNTLEPLPMGQSLPTPIMHPDGITVYWKNQSPTTAAQAPWTIEITKEVLPIGGRNYRARFPVPAGTTSLTIKDNEAPYVYRLSTNGRDTMISGSFVFEPGWTYTVMLFNGRRWWQTTFVYHDCPGEQQKTNAIPLQFSESVIVQAQGDLSLSQVAYGAEGRLTFRSVDGELYLRGENTLSGLAELAVDEEGCIQMDKTEHPLPQRVPAATKASAELPTLTHRVIPNPFFDRVSWRWNAPTAAKASLRVYTLTGQLVYQREDRTAVGLTEWSWLGTDHQGRTLAQGWYVYQITSDGYQFQGKLLKQ